MTIKWGLNSALVVSHVVYRPLAPFDAIEGPYSSVCEALTASGLSVTSLFLPLNGYESPILWGLWKKENRVKIPTFLGKVSFIKYLLDVLLITAFTFHYCYLEGQQRKVLIVGVDPLSCLPLAILRKLANYRLIFYSVDFNQNRFKNRILQSLYQTADRLSSQLSDQVWVVCEALQDYKKEKYSVSSRYIPNSTIFDPVIFDKGKPLKTSHKLAWSGAFLTARTYDMFFDLLKEILSIRPDLEFYLAPTREHDTFEGYVKRYNFVNTRVLHLTSRRQWQEFATTCDVGIAVYDDWFGSTEYIEPLKIWDYLLCGLPFIISSEPSLSGAIRKSGVAYLLAPHNKIADQKSLKFFLDPNNLKSREQSCLELAREYDIQKQIKQALQSVDS
ncbi:MAG: hypothetical protein AAB486_04135 [Patescibacteria group bacterium]